VLVDPEGCLTEGPTWNFFLVKEGALETPSTKNILPGVSRRLTLEMAKGLGLETREIDLRREDALAADEIFCTATSFCLVHAATFEGRAVGDGCPGPVFQQLGRMEAGSRADFVAQARRFAELLPEWERREREAQSNQQSQRNA
jgi:branched-chain amino acid aminotransferase